MTDPNDSMESRQYPDAVVRETYPPLPRHRGNPNAIVPPEIDATTVAALDRYRMQRGNVSLTLPAEQPSSPELPDDPEIDMMKAAGWL